MDVKQKEKLGRYLKHSRRFLWGLGSGNNQGETYKWLQGKGLNFSKGSYSDVTEQLLESPGIEALLQTVIIPRVRERFTEKALDYLRTCWQAGTSPDIAVLKQFNIKDTSPFLDINAQFNYVEGWGEFAGVWFEEIENPPG